MAVKQYLNNAFKLDFIEEKTILIINSSFFFNYKATIMEYLNNAQEYSCSPE